MTQTSMFPQEVRNGKQPQRTSGKTQSAQPSINSNRQSGVPQNRPAQIQQVARHYPQHQNPTPVAYPQSRPGPQRTDGVRLTGRVGRYFEVRQTSTGKSLATFSLATVRPYQDDSGNWLKQTVWQRIVAWGQTAESLGERLEKGLRVSVEGKFKTREWTDRENNLRTTTELVARQVEFLDALAA